MLSASRGIVLALLCLASLVTLFAGEPVASGPVTPAVGRQATLAWRWGGGLNLQADGVGRPVQVQGFGELACRLRLTTAGGPDSTAGGGLEAACRVGLLWSVGAAWPGAQLSLLVGLTGLGDWYLAAAIPPGGGLALADWRLELGFEFPLARLTAGRCLVGLDVQASWATALALDHPLDGLAFMQGWRGGLILTVSGRDG